MAGNSFGHMFVVTTCGESHGPALLGIVDGCPSGFSLQEKDIQLELDRRRPGRSQFTSQRRESDKIHILSGVFEGKTTGAPIGLLIQNQDARSRDYECLKDIFRPGHADFTYFKKYGHRDYRGGGRASARETAMRVAAGAIAKKFLKENLNIHIQAYLAAMGSIEAKEFDLSCVADNDFFFPDKNRLVDLEKAIAALRKAGDSMGARVNVMATGMPAGLGEPVFNKLNADIAHAMMGINAVKGVEIGSGFGVIREKGSQHRDEMTAEGFLSNHAGGILGGISTGQDLLISLAFKPTASITKPACSISTQGQNVEVVTTGRHDPCVGIRAVPIVEAMLALVLMDHYLRNCSQKVE